MSYKHEKSLKSRLLDLEFDTWEEVHQFKREYDELEEVYAKAKAFDEIVKLEKETSLYSVAGKEDVELGTEVREIINKYMERK